jgi:hypothetical protein
MNMSNSIVTKYENQYWYNEEDQLHREDGPAAIHINGAYVWYRNGKVHRTDGPAEMSPDNTLYWYVVDKKYFDNKSFQKAANLSDEDMTAMILKYGNVK